MRLKKNGSTKDGEPTLPNGVSQNQSLNRIDAKVSCSPFLPPDFGPTRTPRQDPAAALRAKQGSKNAIARERASTRFGGSFSLRIEEAPQTPIRLVLQAISQSEARLMTDACAEPLRYMHQPQALPDDSMESDGPCAPKPIPRTP